jgi:hypothetical protein
LYTPSVLIGPKITITPDIPNLFMTDGAATQIALSNHALNMNNDTGNVINIDVSSGTQVMVDGNGTTVLQATQLKLDGDSKIGFYHPGDIILTNSSNGVSITLQTEILSADDNFFSMIDSNTGSTFRISENLLESNNLPNGAGVQLSLSTPSFTMSNNMSQYLGISPRLIDLEDNSTLQSLRMSVTGATFYDQNLDNPSLPIYPDNGTALAAGAAIGSLYYTVIGSDATVKIVVR